EAIWNGLGFPSVGLDKIRTNLERLPREGREGFAIGCNIGPHPFHLRQGKSVDDYVTIARDELLKIASTLHPYADFFVVNLSSPNTPGLRGMLRFEDLSARLFGPLREAVRRCDSESRRGHETPLLVKLPPEDADRMRWTRETMRPVIEPLIASHACDGFVAVNT